MFRSKEQKHFNALIAKHLEIQDAPLLLEGGTGIGKTRAFLAALAGCEARVAVVLPTRQLIDQMAASSDLEAAGLAVEPFHPARDFESRADYAAHRAKAMESRVILCTAASVMIDQRLAGAYNGASQRDYLLFDEADQLPQAAALQRDLTITAADLEAAGVARTTAKETVAALLAKADLDPEVRARAKMIAEALAAPTWYRKVGLNDEGGVALRHELPGRLLKRIANQGNAAFISATLTVSAGADNFDDFRRSMGIDRRSRLSGVVEPKEHGRLSFETPLDHDPAEVVAQAEKPCLVVTPSFADAEELAARLPGAVVRETKADEDERETAAEAAARVAEDGILIAAGAWAGLDTPLRWRSIVVPRIPFEKPTILDGKIESRYVDSRNVATRRMRQVVGRGLRTPDARCTLYVCDARYRTLGRFLPTRFEESREEGGRVEVTLSKIERDPAFRQAAFRHYCPDGPECHACGYVPPNGMTCAIDVHHLHPLAEGKRRTTLEDLIPLCATCHRLAHAETPPLPLDRLRTLAEQAPAPHAP